VELFVRMKLRTAVLQKYKQVLLKLLCSKENSRVHYYKNWPVDTVPLIIQSAAEIAVTLVYVRTPILRPL
jgi:hypothetical protein